MYHFFSLGISDIGPAALDTRFPAVSLAIERDIAKGRQISREFEVAINGERILGKFKISGNNWRAALLPWYKAIQYPPFDAEEFPSIVVQIE